MSQKPDSAPGNYYVSVWDSETRRLGLLAGPFVNDHAGALAMVDAARKVAEELNPRAVWYAFGTVKMKDGYANPGLLNGNLGLTISSNETTPR